MSICIKVSKKKIYATVFILSLLLTAAVGFNFGFNVGRASTSVPIWYFNEPLPSVYDYTVGYYGNGTYYTVSAANSLNQSYYADSSISVCTNWALTQPHETSKELTVLVECGGVVTTMINPWVANYTYLTLMGDLTAKNGLNTPIIGNANPANVVYGVTITGLGSVDINGNGAQQTSPNSSGINFTRSSGSLPTSGYGTIDYQFASTAINNLCISNCYSTGAFFNFAGTGDGGEIGLNDVTIQGCGDSIDTTGYGGGQLVLVQTYDSYVKGGLISGDNSGNAIFLLGCAQVTVNPAYNNGHNEIMNSNGIKYSCLYVDNSGNFNTMNCYGMANSTIFGTQFNFGTGTTNTYDAIHLSGTDSGASFNSTGNQFYGDTFTSYSGPHVFKYGIEETAYCGTNLYYGLDGVSVGTGTVRCLSEAASSYPPSKADTNTIIRSVATS